jgi:hypothetical protein
VKGLTYVHIAVIGHHNEKDEPHKQILCKELGHASIKGDGSILRKGVHNQFGDYDRRVGNNEIRKKYMGDLRL